MSTVLAFTPVPVRPRRDGWTPLRQTMFVLALADLRCVVAAACAVAMSWQSAYRLRARPDAASFAAAWDRALAADLSALPSGRAVGGIATPIRYQGRRVGERRRFDNRLAMYLLSVRRPARYGDGHARAGLQANAAADMVSRGEDDTNPDVARTPSPFAPFSSTGMIGDAPRERPHPSRHARTSVDGRGLPP